MKLRKFFLRLLCLTGIHWEGTTGIGMWGDANECATCGKDRYDLVVLRDIKTGWVDVSDLTEWLFLWCVTHVLLPLVVTLILVWFYKMPR